MNIIKTNEYEGDYTCSICCEKFTENDNLLLIKHADAVGKPEKIADSRHRKHIFHLACMKLYIDSSGQSDVILCPFDREKIHCLVNVRYSEIVALNIINFSDNYYQLLDKIDINCVSIIDHINLNYKDVNGKTLIYCACQRGNLKLVKQLVKMGGNPLIPDDNGFTPLMATIGHNYLKIVKYLLTLPEIIDGINYVDKTGKTAIEYAQDSGNLCCIKELLTIKGLNRTVLLNVLKGYQAIKKPPLHVIDIKNALSKYLKLPPKVAEITVALSSHPLRYDGCPKEPSRVLNLDVVDDPELFDLVYQPLEETDDIQLPPESTDQEIKIASSFTQMNPDLIYQPLGGRSPHRGLKPPLTPLNPPLPQGG